MRKMKVPACFGSLSFSMFLAAPLVVGMAAANSLHAKTQVAPAAAGNAAATQMAAAAATAPKLVPIEGYVFCYSDPSAPVVYFSDVFLGKADPPRGHMRGVSFQNLGGQYLAFLQQKYSYKSSAQCIGGANTSAPAQGAKQRMEDQDKTGNKQIVETGWKDVS